MADIEQKAAQAQEALNKGKELLDKAEEVAGFIDEKLAGVKEAAAKGEEMADKLKTQGEEKLGVAGNIAKTIDDVKADLATVQEDVEYPSIGAAIEDVKAQVKTELGKLKEMIPKMELPKLDGLLGEGGEFSFDKLAADLGIELPKLPELPASFQNAAAELTKFANDQLAAFGVQVQNPVTQLETGLNNALEAASSGDLAAAGEAISGTVDQLEQSLKDTTKQATDYNNNSNQFVASVASSMDAQLTSMGEKFNVSGDKLIELKNGILDGSVNSGNIAKSVENIIKTAAGDIINLGIEITSPSKDAEKGIDDLKDVVAELKEVAAKIESDIYSEEQLQAELEAISAKYGITIKA